MFFALSSEELQFCAKRGFANVEGVQKREQSSSQRKKDRGGFVRYLGYGNKYVNKKIQTLILSRFSSQFKVSAQLLV